MQIVISVLYNVIHDNSNKFSNYSSSFIMVQSGHGFESSFDFSSSVYHAFICTNEFLSGPFEDQVVIWRRKGFIN